MEMRPHTNLSKSNYLSPIKTKAQIKGIILAHGLILERGKIAAQDEYIKGPFCVYIIPSRCITYLDQFDKLVVGIKT